MTHRLRLQWLCFGAMLLAIAPPARAGSQLFAERLTAESVQRLRVGGPDAIAGVGDWVLGNGRVCAAVSDASHESALSDRGGVLIDIGHCGRHDDQFVVLQPMLNLSRAKVLPVSEVSAEVSGGEARIVTRGELGGLQCETRYRVSEAKSREGGAADRLSIETELYRTGEGDRVFFFGDIALHGHRQITPFTLSLRDPAANVGYGHPDVDVDDYLAMMRAIVDADAHVLVGADEIGPPISYGWRVVRAALTDAEGASYALPHLALNGEHFSLLAIFTRPPLLGGVGKPGFLELAQTLFMKIARGERLVFEREILLSQRNDVASITDQLFADDETVRVSGSVDDPRARILVETREGTPLTDVRPDTSGRFAFLLPAVSRPAPEPPSTIVLKISAPGDRHVVRAVELDGDSVSAGRISVGAPAQITLPSEGPVRLTFIGLNGTPDPRMGGDGIAFRVGAVTYPGSRETRHLSLLGREDDPHRITVAPGRYRVLASRGPEWSVEERVIDLAPGDDATLEIAPPRRLLSHPGWLSADLHVHSAASDDSALPLRQRIADFAAQSAEVIVATEHDRAFDYAPTIGALGLSEQIASLVGVEVTSTMPGDVTPYTFGHANAFPFPARPDAYREGAPRSQNRRLRSLVADLRALPGPPLLQLNHPRAGDFDADYGSFFAHLSVAGEPHDPTRSLSQGANANLIERDPVTGLRDVDFDAVELMNGPSMDRYRQTRADWFALLLQGEVRTATANSDSHAAREIVALPRNYVAYEGEGGARLEAARFMTALRAGRLIGSTGPLLHVEVSGAGPGQRHRGAKGLLRIEVATAEWVPVHEVRIYLDGALHSRHALLARAGGFAPLEIPLTFERDAFVTVEVEGDAAAGRDGIYAAVAPGFTPFAFSNPIFVDADGDGRWHPPGLSDPLPTTLTHPTDSP